MTTSRESPPRLIFLLTAAERQLRRWIDARGGSQGISAASSGVILYLAQHPDATITDVTTALQGSPAGVSALLTRMERSGIIDRRADPADRRTTRISLTDAGSATLADLKEALRDLNSQITAGFTAEELGAIARWLEQVAALRR
jgi:DNA-binding MarR family transcriptional regulator